MAERQRDRHFDLLGLTEMAEEIARRLLPSLTQDALNSALSMPGYQRANYSELMKAILEDLSYSQEVHRHRFLVCRMRADETPTMFAQRLKEMARGWLRPLGSPAEDRMLSLVVREQFVDGLPARLSRWVRAHGRADLQTSIILAEEYRQRRDSCRPAHRDRPQRNDQEPCTSTTPAAEEPPRSQPDGEASPRPPVHRNRTV